MTVGIEELEHCLLGPEVDLRGYCTECDEEEGSEAFSNLQHAGSE